MYSKSSIFANIMLSLIVLALIVGEVYVLFLKHTLGVGRVAVAGDICKEDGQSAGPVGTSQKDVYVNCSGFHG